MMRTRSVSTLVLVGILSALPAAALAQVPVDTQRTISGGTELSAPLAGLTFRIPDGFAGGWDTEAKGLVFESARGMYMGLWGWSEGEVEEVAVVLGEGLASLGLELTPNAEPQVSETELVGLFDAWSQEGRGLLAAAVRRGDEGNVFAVAVLGGPDSKTDVEAVRDEVLGSLEFSTPGAATWRSQVEGASLGWSSSGTDMSTGVTTATGGSFSRKTLALCRGEMYRYSEESETYISIEGMSSKSESSDAHSGQWWVTADLAGQALLTLEATDGRVFYWAVEESGDGFMIDGYLYRLGAGC